MHDQQMQGGLKVKILICGRSLRAENAEEVP